MQLSVIMAVYNGERFLAEAVDSVLQQTFRDFELVVVDDGSTDASARILASYRAKDPRVVVISRPNSGLPRSLNHAMTVARGEYVARMDCDDRMLPTRLERQMQFLSGNSDAAVVCSYAWLIDAQGRRVCQSRVDVDLEGSLATCDPARFLEIIHPTVVLRKRDILALGGYSAEITYAEDRELWGRVAAAGLKIRCQPELLLEYRLHSGAMSSQKALRNSATCRFIDANVVRRIKGLPPMSEREYADWYDRQPIWKKLADRRRFWALFQFKNASRYFAERRWAPFAGTLCVAFALRPMFILQRLAQKAL